MAEMTKEVIVALCKANGGYAAPHLNDQLFLHCKGFMAIANLEAYTTIKVLWLEQNAISNLSGLEAQQELVSLFLQNNTIHSLRSLTTPLRNLRVLNLSHNYITSLDGLGTACPLLETLQASHNRIASLEACEDLFRLAGTLSSVDLSFNRITDYEASAAASSEDATGNADAGPQLITDDDIRVVVLPDNATEADLLAPSLSTSAKDPLVLVRFFQRVPNVSVVYMQGNSISHGLKHYRRNMILHLPQLSYLDERPVFPEERRVMEAWGRGGSEAETAERASIREEKKQHLNSCVRVLSDKIEANRELRDRLTRQWDAKRAEEMEQLTQLRRQQRDVRAALESREAAARDGVEKAEQAAWWDYEEAFSDGLPPLRAAEAQHRRDYEQQLAVESVTAEAQREIAAEEAAAALKGAQQTQFEEEAEQQGPRPTGREAILAELAKSDEDILREMEDEIELVLNSLEPSFCRDEGKRRSSHSFASGTTALTSSSFSSPRAVTKGVSEDAMDEETLLTVDHPAAEAASLAAVPFNRAAARMERAVHAAVDQVASKLRKDRDTGAQASEHQQPQHAQKISNSNTVWAQFDQWERRQQ